MQLSSIFMLVCRPKPLLQTFTVACLSFSISLAGCGASMTDLANSGGAPAPSTTSLGAAPSAPEARAAATAAQASVAATTLATPVVVGGAGEPDTIIGFRGSMVVVYSGELRNDGERLAVSSLALPLRARASQSNPGRVEIMTAAGPRWIARADASFATSDAAVAAVPKAPR